MKLSRIRIEQFRQFRQPIEFRDLESGINLFSGPNEAGKSTIVSAIRAAFFERHRSSSVDDLRPWGDTSASPTVELEFAIGDRTYRLTKSFLARKRCELLVGARRLEGAEAEEHLAELLGFRYTGRGASAAEHWGIPGLLWIEQGTAQDIRNPVAHATDHLRTALNESLGEIAGSGGDEVLATVETARHELLTPAAGLPRGHYADAIKQEAVLADAIRDLDTQIAAYRQKVDNLATLRREHAADEAEKPWVNFRTQQQAGVEKLEAIQRIEETLAGEKQQAAQTESRITLLRGQLDTFARQEKAMEERSKAEDAAALALSAATALVEQWTGKRTEADARDEAACETLRLARMEDTRRSLTRQLDDTRLSSEKLAATLAQAETEQSKLLDYQRRAAASEIKPAELEILRERHRQMRELHIQQAAAATRLRFDLAQDRTIRVGTESLAGSGEKLLLDTTSVTLPGLGTIEIIPGGTDLADLRRKEKELGDEQGAALQRLGLDSLETAEARHQTHQQRLAEIKTATATLKALAPGGVEAFRAELAARQARAGEFENALSQLAPKAEQAAVLPAVAQAETAVEAAAKSLETITESLHQAQLAARQAQTTHEAALRELAAAQALLEAPDRAARLAAANRDLVDARAEQATLAARIEELGMQVAEARPDILQQDIERYRRSAEQHEKRHSERRDTLLRLDFELRAAGAQGLEERRAELARDQTQARRRGDELRRRANALDHLLKLLRSKRRAVTCRLQAPLQKHLNRYLQLLFPQASLEIDENLSPGPLTRPGANGTETGDFDALSFGAREQTGVISRLAYADLLQEAGRPTLIILDDALVHSDEDRLAQMKRVLFDASTRHQILLFTCHPEKWRDLGVGARTLEAMRGTL